MESLDAAGLSELAGIVGLGSLRAILAVWAANQANSEEEFWQSALAQHAPVLTQVLAYPVLVIKDKAYLGGKGIDNTKGNVVDFLCQNPVTGNVVLVEIKTPMTQLPGRKYRGDVYNISSELAGAVVQASNYQHSIVSSYHQLSERSENAFAALAPRCVILAGNYSRELSDEGKRRSFELFRARLHGIEILTYDEFFAKAELLKGLIR